MSFEVVKSVGRVFEILELFDKERGYLSAKQISERLGYPLASAHAICKSMHHLGYLDFNRSNWGYIPTRTLLSAVEWIPDSLEQEKNILSFIDALNHETKETVNLSRISGAEMRIVHGVESKYAIGVSVKEGTTMPILHSLTGLTAYSCLGEPERQRIKADETVSAIEYPVSRDESDKIFTELYEFGTVARCDLAISGIGAVCFPIKLLHSGDIMVVGVVGPSDRIKENKSKYARIIKRLAGQYEVQTCYPLKLGPQKASRITLSAKHMTEQ